MSSNSNQQSYLYPDHAQSIPVRQPHPGHLPDSTPSTQHHHRAHADPQAARQRIAASTPYYFPYPLGRGEHQSPDTRALMTSYLQNPPEGPCDCWSYMPIGQHNPLEHGYQENTAEAQEIVNAQAAAARKAVEAAGCPCSGYLPEGVHDHWHHQIGIFKPKEKKRRVRGGGMRKRQSEDDDEEEEEEEDDNEDGVGQIEGGGEGSAKGGAKRRAVQ